ncbi:MAG TPA: APC family permease [candidate division Zixibacteria bacterium]|nr:APC family permease [candidate division Zixibacteria bacterium]
MASEPPDRSPGSGRRRDATSRRVDPLLEVRETRRGRRPGDAYVRIVRPFEDEFERGDTGTLIASEKVILAGRGWQSWLRALRTFLIGRPISSEHEEHERLSKLKALAVFSSDNISSSAYGPEEIMRVLSVAGVAALGLTVPLAALIVVMLAVVTISYRQTIKAYPQGASSYIVAGDNLGDTAGVLAASALLIGYVVTVAVSISAGVLAMTSIIPELFPYKVAIAVGAVAVLTLGNLRGIRESGTIFMAPTYLYIGVIGAVVVIGFWRLGVGGGIPPVDVPDAWLAAESGAGALSLLLVLRAFSQGAVALSGVEAVSDGVPAFKAPEWRNARTTLTWAAVTFAVLFLGISVLAAVSGIVPDPTEQQTVLSMLVRHVVGGGPFLVLAQVATALILVLAANTSFADFPRLSSFLARDGFLPRQFAFRGERLAFTTGILALSGMAGVLLVVFDASVAGLIPLYTLGVFVAFTLSQSGMLVRWWRRREPGWRPGLVINGLGAAITGVVVLVVGVANFTSGAWLVVVLVPMLMLLLTSIRRHYRSLERLLDLERIPAGTEVAAEPIVIVPIARLDRTARQAIAFGKSISRDATAVHITNDPESAAELRRRWPEWAGETELVVVESPYRALVGPLLRYLDALQAQDPGRPVLVVLSEVVPRHWWENFLHNQTALRLKLRLFRRPNTIVADIPYHVAAEGPVPTERPL